MTMVYEKEQLTTGALDRMWRLRVPGSLVAIGPSFGITLLFIYGFIGWTAYISFSASKMTPNAKLVGLANYYKLWQFDSWVVAVSNLFIFTVLYVGIGMAVGLGLAILLDQRVRAEGFFRTIFLYPAALSPGRDGRRLEMAPQSGNGHRGVGA
jgi:glucose/mannose transport system permease protein